MNKLKEIWATLFLLILAGWALQNVTLLFKYGAIIVYEPSCLITVLECVALALVIFLAMDWLVKILRGE